MTRLLQSARASRLTGAFLAALLFVSSRLTIWPVFVWLRNQWIQLNQPPPLFWLIGILYFTLWVWLVMFLSNQYDQYPGMSMDALFGGSLFAVASALHDAEVMSGLSKRGFGWAGWVVFVAACGLLLRNFGGMSKINKKASEPSSNPVGDEGFHAG
jgi:hypothetical protein